jgi:ubiquitin-like 1-activating enzyme E1 B
MSELNTTPEKSNSQTPEIEYHDEKILSDKKILVVGAGGIGCELLKLLVINGFKKISIIDMDKIERSNLNRQFLFDHSSIGKNKCEIAVEKVKEYRQDPTLEITPYIGNIKDEDKFGTKFYSNFDLIMNALDNNDARYYINNVCIKLNIPLINSGSEGIYGMVNWHIRGLTPCFAWEHLLSNICSSHTTHFRSWLKFYFQ